MPRRANSNGFTLVELLLASALGAMVLTAAFTSMSVMLKGYRKHKDRAEIYEPARLALARMSREISSAFLSPHGNSTHFVGIPQSIEGVSMDQLSFLATVNDPLRSEEGQSDVCEVHYMIDIDPETPERWLQVRYDPTLDEDPMSGGNSHLLGPRVVAMQFLYFDGNFWLSEWDSEEEIPMAVRITIGVTEDGLIEDPEDVIQFSTVAYPAVYQMDEETLTL